MPPQRYEVYNPSYEEAGGRHFSARHRFGTSLPELLHLALATSVLTAAFVLWLLWLEPPAFATLAIPQIIFLSLGIVVLGFVLHEVAHKITAQHYGHWSEFRSSLGGLAFTLFMSGVLHVLVGAPGATWHTATSVRDNGKISAAGPLTNLVIALIALPFTRRVTGDEDFLNIVADGVLMFNTILAIFNLIPLWQLDGRKILRWNAVIYGILVGLTVILVVTANPFEGLF